MLCFLYRVCCILTIGRLDRDSNVLVFGLTDLNQLLASFPTHSVISHCCLNWSLGVFLSKWVPLICLRIAGCYTFCSTLLGEIIFSHYYCNTYKYIRYNIYHFKHFKCGIVKGPKYVHTVVQHHHLHLQNYFILPNWSPLYPLDHNSPA